LNPFIGYLADKVSLRYFVILAPAITATLISLLGFAPNFGAIAAILFFTGFSVAAFHAPAPAMISRISGSQVGKGMSWFMAAGELSRAIGPLLAVWAVSLWTLDGIYRLVLIGWTATLVLYLRLRNIPARPTKQNSLRAVLPALRYLFLPLLVVVFFRNFINVSLTTYLPTYMSSKGASLWVSGAALAILEFAGVAGALASGTISDRLGRKPVLFGAILISSALMFVFINTAGWLLVPVLLGMGFASLSTAPVMLAIVQDYLPANRAIGNGLFLSATFLLRPVSTLAIGFIGDLAGLDTAYLWSAVIALLALPAILALPTSNGAREYHQT